MDSLVTAAARALAAGDPLGALKRVALRDDAPALALRGIAMAQLGEFVRAAELLRRAARAFRPQEAVARARCIVAEAEIALASRNLGWPVKTLDAARLTLEARGDRLNAAYARYIQVRRLALIGSLIEAEQMLSGFDPTPFPPAWRTVYELVVAGIAIRRLRINDARHALTRAEANAREARIPALTAEVETALRMLNTPAARLVLQDQERLLLPQDVEALLESNTLIVDACSHAIRCGHSIAALASRPVLFALARALAEAWPGEVPRDQLLARAFGARFVDESHRARLRVEIGRLRKALRTLAAVDATKLGFRLTPLCAPQLAVLAPPVEEEHGAVLAFLAEGEAWSTSALALALGASQRTIQRALDSLAARGKVQSFGRGRARRWITPPVPGFTTILLLPAPLPGD